VLDENLPWSIAAELKARGYLATSNYALNASGLKDPEWLEVVANLSPPPKHRTRAAATPEHRAGRPARLRHGVVDKVEAVLLPVLGAVGGPTPGRAPRFGCPTVQRPLPAPKSGVPPPPAPKSGREPPPAPKSGLDPAVFFLVGGITRTGFSTPGPSSLTRLP
jgi:hypothetical protein